MPAAILYWKTEIRFRETLLRVSVICGARGCIYLHTQGAAIIPGLLGRPFVASRHRKRRSSGRACGTVAVNEDRDEHDRLVGVGLEFIAGGILRKTRRNSGLIKTIIVEAHVLYDHQKTKKHDNIVELTQSTKIKTPRFIK